MSVGDSNARQNKFRGFVCHNVRRKFPEKNINYGHIIQSHQNAMLKSPNYPCERCPKSGTNTSPHALYAPRRPCTTQLVVRQRKCSSDQDQLDVN